MADADDPIEVDRLDRTVQVEVVDDLAQVTLITETLTLTEPTHAAYTDDVQAAGYESIAAYYETDYTDLAAYGQVSATETAVAGGYSVEIEITEIDPIWLALTYTNATFQDGNFTYESWDVTDPADTDLIEEYRHTVVMPEEIIASNADYVEDDTAVWELHETHRDPLLATSEAFPIPDIPDVDDHDVDDVELPDPDDIDVPDLDDIEPDVSDLVDDIVGDDDPADDADMSSDVAGDDDQPGFGVLLGVVGLLVTAGIASRHR